MKILSWNVRGLGQSRTVRLLKNKLRHIQPQILFLIETKVTSRKMESIRRRCGFMNGIDVDAIGWKEGINLSLKSYSRSHIDVEVEEENGVGKWRLTGFYGEPVEQNRRELWELLRSLQRGSNLPWLVVGDFNEILFSFEKQGGRMREERQMEAFRKALEDCELADLGFSGQWYTWERGRLASNNIRERLDRGVTNPKWWDLFANFEVNHLQHSFLDHCPVVVSTNTNGGRYNSSQSRRFKFNADWILSPTCEEHIKNIWLSSSQDVLVKLQELGRSLQDWAKSERKSRLQCTTELIDRLCELGECEISEDLIRRRFIGSKELEPIGLKWGTKTQPSFIKVLHREKEKNEVKGLEDEFGTLKTETGEMEKMATNYFKELFSSKGISDCSGLMESFQPNITEGHNRDLTAEFTPEEIVLAIKLIGPLKAPGMDGFPAIFHYKFWHIVGEEITKFCLNVLKGEKNMEEVNFTNIILIPKDNSPKQMNQFRLISLCNVIYKIISKVIVNRFRKVLNLFIEDSQGAFISGRQIADSIFVAYEILHSFKKEEGLLKKGLH
ncbi:reverse transcriptase [Gossypium australe]|uniref:Reverse transcriptase n=1 Tax=Gossypium australe TaxID=47621 RepID=A0A5B6UIV4_9ROSI|nr:reverse transcriptase [Gossypium australe]